jgi:hypothetical protein
LCRKRHCHAIGIADTVTNNHIELYAGLISAI